MRKLATLALLILMALTAACSAIPATGDTAEQALSAQSQMPSTPPNYTVIEADNIQSLLETTATGATVTTGNLLGAAAVNRISVLVECYRDVGAVDFKGYISPLEAGGGLVIVINTDRATNNLIQCINQAAGSRNGNRAMDASFQPCVKNGSFSATDNGVTNAFTYLYVGTTPSICNAFQIHFTNKGG